MTEERYTGPAVIDCPEKCDVPTGVTLTVLDVLPEHVRHAWTDTLVCPNGCGRVMLVFPEEAETENVAAPPLGGLLYERGRNGNATQDLDRA